MRGGLGLQGRGLIVIKNISKDDNDNICKGDNDDMDKGDRDDMGTCGDDEDETGKVDNDDKTGGHNDRKNSKRILFFQKLIHLFKDFNN